MSQWFETATPESQGISSNAILSFIEEIEREQIGIDSLIIMRRNKIVAEGYWAPFEQGDPHRLFSAGKAIAATAILIAIDEGRLHLEDTVANLLKDSLPAQYSDKYDRMTLYHLLTMNTGHTTDTFGPMLQAGGDRALTFFSIPPEKEPGTHFLYNNGVPDILGIILYKATGQRLFEYLEDRLFRPLEMDSMYVERYQHLDELPTMSASTRSLFKLAYLYANHGMWGKTQIISRNLADMAGAYLSPSLQNPEPTLVAYDTKFGYGFQIWRNSVGGFRIDGGRGQFGIVIPDMDLVAAINATEQDQGVLPILFWKHITNQLYATARQEDTEAYSKLKKKLSNLSWAERGNQSPAQDLCRSYHLERPHFGISKLSLSMQGEHLILHTDFNGSCEADLGICNDGEWHKISLPILPEDQTYYGSNVRRGSVTGGNISEAYACTVCHASDMIEIHLRSKGFMGCKILRIGRQSLTYLPYDDFARENRSSTVKHENLDRMAISGIIEVQLIPAGK